MNTKELIAALVEAARGYIQRGFYVVPIPSGKNHPTIKGWQKMRLCKMCKVSCGIRNLPTSRLLLVF